MDMEESAKQNPEQRPIKTPAVLDSAYMVTSKDGSHIVVRASSTIRAPAGKVAAFIFGIGITDYWHLLVSSSVFSKVIEQQNDCHFVMHHREGLPKPLQDRDLVLRVA